jgi:hypothetical protein
MHFREQLKHALKEAGVEMPVQSLVVRGAPPA